MPALLENILLIQISLNQNKIQYPMSVSRDEEIKMYSIAVQFDQSSWSVKDRYEETFYLKLKCFLVYVRKLHSMYK